MRFLTQIWVKIQHLNHSNIQNESTNPMSNKNIFWLLLFCNKLHSNPSTNGFTIKNPNFKQEEGFLPHNFLKMTKYQINQFFFFKTQNIFSFLKKIIKYHFLNSKSTFCPNYASPLNINICKPYLDFQTLNYHFKPQNPFSN